jgi:acyl-CoA synthetase (AMP-forming)/AMP-acid ligase II
MTTYNLSELVEATTDVVADRVALVTEQRQLSFADLDARANQLAHHLRAAGFGPGDMIGLHLHNGTEYVEAMLAAFKIRAVPVNINYRYVAGELEALYRYTDLVALIFHRGFSSVISPVTAQVPAIRHLLVVADGSHETPPQGAIDYESALGDQPTARAFAGRSSDDIYVTCTGGTTGQPKAVLWRHEDLVFAAFNGGDITGQLGPVTASEQLAERARQNPPAVQLALAPLMHVTGHWAVLAFLIGGGTTILSPPGKLDPGKVWHLVSTHDVNLLSLVGDAMARPLIEEYQRHPVPVPRLGVLGSGGARISPSTKADISRALPHVAIFDGLGSSESGIIARSRSLDKQDAAGFPSTPLPPSSTSTIGHCRLAPASSGGSRVAVTCRSAISRTKPRPKPPSSKSMDSAGSFPVTWRSTSMTAPSPCAAAEARRSTPAARKFFPKRWNKSSWRTQMSLTPSSLAAPTIAGVNALSQSSNPWVPIR